nr:hypothetical protein [Lysinibacillus timonensis]
MRNIFILFTIISFALVGCSQEHKSQNVATNSSLHNYDFEMITEALKKHPDFPKLNANDSITEDYVNGENTYTVTYTSKTDVNSHGPTITTDPNNENSEMWIEESSADYFITLIQEWETNEGDVKSYWKYKYIPQTNEIELVESEDNEQIINSTTRNMPKEMPSDFDFSIRFGVQKRNELNTYEGTVTKDLIADGTASTELTLTEEEMKDIYGKMRDINIAEMKDLTPEPINGALCVQEPYEEDAWKIMINGETITHFISGEYCEPTNDAKQLIELRNYIFNIIKSKDEYKSLPESKGGYA